MVKSQKESGVRGPGCGQLLLVSLALVSLLSRVTSYSPYPIGGSRSLTSKLQHFKYRSTIINTQSSFTQSTDSLSHNWDTEDKNRSPAFISNMPTSSVCRHLITMGKGDGKKKRKKKSATPSPSPEPVSPQPAPRRVSNDINIPIKHQIRMAQYNKAMSKQRATGFRKKKVERTSYRRTWDEEEIEEKAEERRRRGQDPDWDVILSRNFTSPLVIVDGYNIIHKWPRLKKHMNKGDPRRARQLLIDDLENLRAVKGWRIEVVFDGTGRSTVGPLGDGPRGSKISPLDKATQKSVTNHGVREVYTGVGVEADSYIESRCAKAKNVTSGELTGRFIVATDDAMIRLAGQSAGALCMSSERFVNELKALKKAVSYRVEAAVAKANGQAIRPEKLRGTRFHNFGRGSVLIEDKRNRKAKKEKPERKKLTLEDVGIEVEENGSSLPWWAVVPNRTKPGVY